MVVSKMCIFLLTDAPLTCIYVDMRKKGDGKEELMSPIYWKNIYVLYTKHSRDYE